MLIDSAATLSWIFLSGFVTPGRSDEVQVNLKAVQYPQNMSITVGDEVSFVVIDSEGQNEFCSFTPPPINNAAQKNIRFKPVANQGPQPFPDVDGRTWRPENEWTWQWYGSNIQTDCGLKITKTVRYDNGEWMFAFANADGGFYLYVKAPPELITFYHQPGYIPEPGSDFTSGSVQFQLTSPDMVKSYNATCFAKSARPEAQVTWFIGNEQIPDDGRLSREKQWTTDESWDIYDTLTYTPKPSDDGKILKCSYSHEAYTSNDYNQAVNMATCNISIQAYPDPNDYTVTFANDVKKIGDEATLEINFHANPAPTKFSWTVPDVSDPLEPGDGSSTTTMIPQLRVDQIPVVPSASVVPQQQGQIIRNNINQPTKNSPYTYGRYTVNPLVSNDYDHVASLTISKIDSSDVDQVLVLTVENAMGTTNYTITLDMLDPRLETGAIVGIAVGIVVVIVAIAAVAFFLVRRKNRPKKRGNGATVNAVSTNPAATPYYSSGHEDKTPASTGVDNPTSRGQQDEENIEIDPQQSSVVE